MKRLAWLALALVVTFLGASLSDHCEEATDGDCPPACHFSCVDGCAVAPGAVAPATFAASVRGAEHGVEPPNEPLDLDFPPDLVPPRA